MNNKTLQIALFNVLKQKRRSLLNSMTFAITMMAMIFVLGLIRGTYNSMIDKTIDLQVGHLKIYKKGYLEEKKRMPLDIAIKDPDAVIADVLKVKNVKGAAKHIVTTGILSSGAKKTGMMFCGIDLEKEKTVTSAYNNISGTALGTEGGRIYIGKRLAKLMAVEPGMTLMIYGRTVDNANNLVDAEIAGVYAAGYEFMEKNFAAVPFNFASWYLGMDGSATEIKIVLHNKNQTAGAKKAVAEMLKEKYPDLIVRDWMEEAPEIIFAVQQDMITYAIIFMILIFLSFFIVVNTMTISVFERTAEIGTLRAIGMQKQEVKKMFLAEGILLGIAGVIIGGILVMPLVYFMNVHGISMENRGLEDFAIPFDPVMKGISSPVDWLISGLVCIVSAVLGAWMPASKAAKLVITDALKKGVR